MVMERGATYDYKDALTSEPVKSSDDLLLEHLPCQLGARREPLKINGFARGTDLLPQPPVAPRG